MELLNAIASAPDPASRRRLLDRLVAEFGHRADFPQVLGRLNASQRLYAAAKAMEQRADRPEAVQPLLEQLIQGCGKARSLQMLIDLQHRVRHSSVLDEHLARRLARTRLACPKCNELFNREDLIRHLWFRHQLMLDRGKAVTPRLLVERVLNDAVQSDDPAMLARAYSTALTYFQPLEPVQVHQALTARMQADEDDLEPLAARARKLGCGLCPRCFTAAPDRLPAMPPPLAARPGRLLGEGFEVDLGPVPPRCRRAVYAALGVALIGMVLTLLMPVGTVLPLLMALLTALCSILTLLLLTPKQSAWTRHDAVDAAWRDLALRVGRSPAAVRFLTRLCRTSLKDGRPEQRFETVWSHVEHAAVLSGKSDAAMQWFAAVRVVQAHDAARAGRDWVSNLAGMLAPVFRADITPVFAESAAETLLASGKLNDGDTARLRVALLSEAFSASLAPAEVLELARTCPHLGTLLTQDEPLLAGLYAVWKQRDRRPWDRIAPARTVFEFVASPASNAVMARHPDTLLVQRLPSAVGRELGPVIIGRRGVSLADRTLREPNSDIRVVRDANGSRLIMGHHSIASSVPLPERLADVLTDWLQWLDSLPEAADGSEMHQVRAIMAPVIESCRLCRQRFVPRSGQVGLAMPKSWGE